MSSSAASRRRTPGSLTCSPALTPGQPPWPMKTCFTASNRPLKESQSQSTSLTTLTATNVRSTTTRCEAEPARRCAARILATLAGTPSLSQVTKASLTSFPHSRASPYCLTRGETMAGMEANSFPTFRGMGLATGFWPGARQGNAIPYASFWIIWRPLGMRRLVIAEPGMHCRLHSQRGGRRALRFIRRLTALPILIASSPC